MTGVQIISSWDSSVLRSKRTTNAIKMKFVVLTLALIGAASAGYIAPLTTGYAGYNAGFAAPSVATFGAPVAYNAPLIAATPVAPVVKSFVAAAPAITRVAAPAISTFAAPAISTYAAAPAISAYAAAPALHGYAAAPAFNTYGAQAIYGNGLGADAFGYDLWKKKKAAAH